MAKRIDRIFIAQTQPHLMLYAEFESYLRRLPNRSTCKVIVSNFTKDAGYFEDIAAELEPFSLEPFVLD